MILPPADKLMETGGALALAALVVREVFAYLRGRKEESAARTDDEYKQMKIREIIDERLAAFFRERDLHIQSIVRGELEKHHHREG